MLFIVTVSSAAFALRQVLDAVVVGVEELALVADDEERGDVLLVEQERKHNEVIMRTTITPDVILFMGFSLFSCSRMF